MTFTRNVVIFCLVFMNLHLSWANDKVVSIGVADFPRYSIVDGTSISGVEVEIVQENLSQMGYQVKFVSYPYSPLLPPNKLPDQESIGV